MSKQSPLWPNPAPNGPIKYVRREHAVRAHSGANIFRVDGSDTLIHVIDGEPLAELLNRVYALGQMDAQKAVEDLAVELAADALKELAWMCSVGPADK